MSQRVQLPIHGRGALDNPASRFAPVRFDPADASDDLGDFDEAAAGPRTDYLIDSSHTVIAYNDSPDVGFAASVNVYRGCEHGCIYCFARPTHEYLDLSAGLDFESKILVKLDAPRLLRQELSHPRWQPQVLQMAGVTDCYQPVERRLKLTRQCLQVLAHFRNPVSVITKNFGVTRDMDLLQELAAHSAVAVTLSVTTLQNDLAAKMEPRASTPARRLAAISALASANVPVGVMVAPIIPGLTDHELPAILRAAADAGARWTGYVPLRLPFGLKDLFADWLAEHFPDRQEKVLNRVRSLRGGKLNDGNFGSRMRGEGFWAQQLHHVFDLAKKRARLDQPFPTLSTAAFRRADDQQMQLW